ncbi:MAG TPA: tetratricopeptide repeat protein [Kofleriaceae bacterium]|nr:tetratricopeptide repeat protein [Kofleriaceae bacterium]
MKLIAALCLAACSAPAVQSDLATAEAEQRAGHDDAALSAYVTAQTTCKKMRDQRLRRDTCAQAHIGRAELLEDLDRRAEAAAAYEAVPRALTGVPGDDVAEAKATYRAGRLRLALGEEERGYDLLWRTITEYPDVAYANDALRTLLADGRARNPRQLYDVLAGLVESLADNEIADALLYAMADLAEHELGSPAVALQHLDRIAKDYPEGGLRDEAWWHGARIARALGDPRGAAARLRQLEATREVAFGIGSYFSIWLDDGQLELGRILRDDLHDLPDAAAAFAALPRLYPASILRDDALWELAVTQDQAGRRDRACAALTRLKKDWPESKFELEQAPALRTRLECP